MTQFTNNQLAAVITDGPLIITAGPGAGKTRVMVARAARFIDQGINPKHIHCITFTKDATAEFKQRLSQEHIDGNMVNVATIHALAYRIIKDVTGRKPNIIDDAKRMNWARHVDFDAPDDVLNRISCIRTSNTGTEADKKLAAEYLEFLKDNNATDMDGLVHIAHSKIDDWLQKNEIKAILVDEFQDTDLAQYRFIREIIRKSGADACVVGDSDQSVYGFRGAMPQMFGYIKQDLDAKTINLTDCFRSLPHITQAANAIIDTMPREQTKIVVSKRKTTNATVPMEPCGSALRQSLAIIDHVNRFLEIGIPASEIAVLARTRDNLTLPAIALKHAGLPVNITSWQNPFKSKTRRIVLGLIRFMAESIDLPTFTNHAASLGFMFDVNAIDALKKLSEKPFEAFEEAVANMFNGWARKSALHALEVARESFGGDWQKLEARCMKMTQPVQPNNEGVILATAHAAKGREWQAVIVIGADDLSYPHPSCVHVHEERRILYVAMTRAKDELVLLSSTHAMCQFIQQDEPRKPEKRVSFLRRLFGG